jgi:hypothetical protein
MGQYHIPVNIDKREYLNPHKFGNGMKMLEWGTGGGTVAGLTVLLACSHNRGGGDLHGDIGDIGGRWAGDRIIVLGDYTEPGDPGTASLYEMTEETERVGPATDPFTFVNENFTDISRQVIEHLRQDDYLAADFDNNKFYQMMLEMENKEWFLSLTSLAAISPTRRTL